MVKEKQDRKLTLMNNLENIREAKIDAAPKGVTKEKSWH